MAPTEFPLLIERIPTHNPGSLHLAIDGQLVFADPLVVSSEAIALGDHDPELQAPAALLPPSADRPMQMVALGGQDGDGRNFPPALIYSSDRGGQHQPELGQMGLVQRDRARDLPDGSYDFDVSFARSLADRRAQFPGITLVPSPPPPAQQDVHVLSLGRIAEHGHGGNRSDQMTRMIQQGPAAAVSPAQFLQLDHMRQGSPASGSGDGLVNLVINRPQ